MATLSLVKQALSELAWYLFSGTFFQDMVEFRRFLSTGRAEIIFYYKSGIDEQWLGSAAEACHDRLPSAVVVNAREALSHQKKKPGQYLLSRFAMPWLRCRAFVSTATLTKLGYPRRAEFIVNMPHSLVSLHAIYAPDAFDHYNVIFSAGAHHSKEIASFDIANGRNPRTTLPVGYGKMDLLLTEYSNKPHEVSKNSMQVLLAPSWGKGNVLETIGQAVVSSLLERGFSVVLRPHPMQYESSVVKRIFETNASNPLFTLEDPSSSQDSLYKADLLISDYSGVALEYAFLRLRPVLFIDVPPKIGNPNWLALGLPAVELDLRRTLGQIVPPDDLEGIISGALQLLKNSDKYEKAIRSARQDYMFNFGSAGQAAYENLALLLERETL